MGGSGAEERSTVDVAETRAAVELVLEQHLISLTDAGGRSAFPGTQLTTWDVPDEAKVALGEYGLPRAVDDGLVKVVAGFQEGTQPETEAKGELYYVLGTIGSTRIGASKGAGVVRSVPEPFEPHPQLAHLFPDGQAPSFINSSVAQFVECAWRYDQVLPLLVQEHVRAGAAEVEADRAGWGRAVPDFYVHYQELCGLVLDRFRAIDPQIDPSSGFWAETIIDVW
jgi:hypothetical protein